MLHANFSRMIWSVNQVVLFNGFLSDFEEITSCVYTGLQLTAGQRTTSGQNWVLTGQILGLPDILSGPLPTRSKKF